MESGMNNRRLFADVFHDVDLTAIGPAGCINVVAQHPKCRPDALTKGNLDARFKPSVGLRELIPGKQSRRSIVASYVIRTSEGFLERLDYQCATLEIGVGRAARVGLKFVVPP